jgi:hypothetical protein
MRIAIFIGVLVMDAMRSHPCDRAAFHGQRAAQVRKYSIHTGVLYPRCVSRRW